MPARIAPLVLTLTLSALAPQRALPLARAQPATRQGTPETSSQIPAFEIGTTWAWLRTAPVGSSNALGGSDGPGQAAFDAALATADTGNPQSLVLPALAARLEMQLARLEPDQRAQFIDFLSAHPELAFEFAATLGPRDDIPAALGVLRTLISAHGERVAELAPLAAAMCAVHDQPVVRQVNENLVKPIAPAALFAYFAANERAMHFPPGATPARLLVHVVDATGTIEQLEWARGRYGRDKNVGNRYQEISYDTRSATQGTDKRVTASGEYTLQSIRQNGGVCADQAYFAMTVGKAAGIPACYVRGKGGEVSHAWVGFLEQAGRKSVRWNFTEGRYKDYEDVQGKVRDPQTGETVPDASLAVEALTASVGVAQRRESLALADAAWRAGYLAARRGPAEARSPELRARQLDLLEGALRLDPGNLGAWSLAGTLVGAPDATREQKERWTRAVDQLAGASSPDFAFEVLRPIFASEADAAARFRLWEWAAGRFRSRPDLAAQARLEQARALIEQGRTGDAVAAARAVFDEFGDRTPQAVEALALAEGLLREGGGEAEALKMYEQAFRKLRQPRRMSQGFLVQTSWYQVGSRYAALLEAAGDSRKASTVRSRLESAGG